DRLVRVLHVGLLDENRLLVELLDLAVGDPLHDLRRLPGRGRLRARDLALAQATAAGKPAQVVERIADGKVEKFYQEAVLVEQAFVKDPEKTVGQVVVERAGKEALDLRF